MEQKFIQRETDNMVAAVAGGRARRLILFFAGWGMDASIFASLSKPGYDIMLVYDYRDADFDTAALEGYDEICVLAWSLGVWHAGCFISAYPHLPVTRTIAVNGTLRPISDLYGIPPRIYDLTSRLPDESAFLKFFRRICGGQTQMLQLMPRLPERDIDELRDELLAVRACISDDAAIDTAKWDEIYLSDSDQIFPFENMKRAWADASARVRVMPGAHHAVDFNRLIEGAFVDKTLVCDRFASASLSYETEAEVQMKVADTIMAAALPELTDTAGKKIIEVGSGTGVLTRKYQPEFSNSHLQLWDLAPSEVAALNGNIIDIGNCDAELEIRRLPDASVNILFSSSTIQWFNSPRRFLEEVVRILSPGGKAFISCYIEGTVPEISRLDGVSPMHYPQLDDKLSQLPSSECETFTQEFEITFDTAAGALAHMRATGVNSLARNTMPISVTRRLMQMLTVDGRAVLKFNTKFIIIRKNG